MPIGPLEAGTREQVQKSKDAGGGVWQSEPPRRAVTPGNARSALPVAARDNAPKITQE
ncbi:MAG: hypothetical protein N838_26625 [Thiohalocapsa sp. PB-PSB1]|nr:MAG: hypothetical protein N838_26625 [Thiohalocapsa sp. PB-PSB1]